MTREKVDANTDFEHAYAKNYSGKDFDLVTFFDCLHDMGDPAEAAETRVRLALTRGHLDDRGALGQGNHCGESKSLRTSLLQRLLNHMRPGISVIGGRARPWG